MSINGGNRITYAMIPMAARKRLALIAHDHCKGEMLEWARYNRGTLGQHELYATGTTGALLWRAAASRGAH